MFSNTYPYFVLLSAGNKFSVNAKYGHDVSGKFCQNKISRN